MLSTLFMVGLIGCAAAIPATAIMAVLKKKASIPLALFGLSTLLVLGAGLAAPGSDPFPERQAASQYTRSEIRSSQPYETIRAAAQPIEEDVPVEEEALPAEPQDIPEEEAAAGSLAENEPVPSPAASTPPKLSGSKSTSRAASTAASADPSSAAAPEAPGSAMPLTNTAPVLAEDDNSTSDSGPALAGDPVIAPMPDPTLIGDPESNDSAGPVLPDSGDLSSGT